jgi:predicted extracellular nuclease
MHYRLSLALFVWLSSLLPLGSVLAQSHVLFVAHYNVENLFDTINDPNTSDEDFLPESKLNWNTERYAEKLQRLSKVIGDMHLGRGPDLLGLCEIENRLVLNDLRGSLKIAGRSYEIAHAESPDQRGIDVALFYDPSAFRVFNLRMLHVTIPGENSYPTRDVMLVSGLVGKKSRLHVFVNHWPSRRGGQETSEASRVAAAQVVRHAIDSLKRADPKSYQIVMGDFNDTPLDRAPREVMGADSLAMPKAILYNPFIALSYDSTAGSYRYRGNWQYIDHISLSGNMFMPNSKLKYVQGTAGPVLYDYLLEQEGRFKGNPWRSYAGDKYLGGYSDHLPVSLQLKVIR